ncbi:chemotaxis protein CheB [Pirellulaceae bacterium SH449]
MKNSSNLSAGSRSNEDESPLNVNSEALQSLEPKSRKINTDGEMPKPFPIVGIVASAGGLDAFKKFFLSMPTDSGMAFVLVPHLDPSHDSLMVELLSKYTSMPVVEAEHGMSVLTNRVYIIPPQSFLAISDARLQLSQPPKDRRWQTSIDFFLRSLAQNHGERAIGIVLSGTGSHGALGVREIKLAGGMVIAQEPESAEYDQMPKSAIDTGVVDCVLPPEQMPAALISFLDLPTLKNIDEASAVSDPSSDYLNRVLAILHLQMKHDFRPYRKPMVLRRIQRRMGLVHISSIASYLDHLAQRPEEVVALCRDLLISVTAFFRDPEAFRILENEIIPDLLARQKGDMAIRVWVPGCATGEEAYSIAMLLFEGVAERKLPMAIQIFASDIDADAIEVARAGIYPSSVVSDVSPERLNKFFVMIDEDRYQINKQIRDSIVFSNQNLIGDAPFSKLDLISCRNLLIYLESEMQQKVISLFHFALEADGYLLLGPSETIGRSTDIFTTVSKTWRVYRRTGSARRDLVSFPLTKTEERRRMLPHHVGSAPQRKNYKELTEQIVLNEFAPASALINQNLELLYVTGPLVNYLEFPRGELTKDLLAMARPGLRTKLRAVCHQAMRNQKISFEGNAKVKRNGRYLRCSITVRPLTEPKEAHGLLLVLFHDSGVFDTHSDQECTDPSDPLGMNQNSLLAEMELSQSEDSRIVQQLELELKSKDEELYSTIEEMESSNEELKTSNEEIMSINEELQSVNEELETSKEELQSLNEELGTVNSELQEKVAELDKTTDDLLNLISSTEIATIFLDKQLNIKKFTPSTKSLLNLLSTDIGRPLRDIAPRFVYDQMMAECQEVLIHPTTLDREIETDDNRFYLRRILPYRTGDHDVDGVVITFVEITQRKRAESLQREADAKHFAELYESAERLKAILNTAMDAILTFDSKGKIETVNEATERIFRHKSDQLIGKNLSVLIPSFLESPGHSEGSDTNNSEMTRSIGKRCELFARCSDGTVLPIDLAITRIDHLDLYCGILRDISDRKQLQAHILEIASEEQRRIGQELHDGTQQELIGLSLFSGSLGECLGNAKRAEVQGGVEWNLVESDYQQLVKTTEKLNKGLKEANLHVQKLSHGIMPVQIDARGLHSALTELAIATDEQQGVRCRFETEGTVVFPNSVVATQLYRIAQESLNNALKHGQATEILIALKQQEGMNALEIRDDGVGFDTQHIPQPLSDGVGVGLRIMEYRAGIIGGELQISSRIGSGTTVRCTIPAENGLL